MRPRTTVRALAVAAALAVTAATLAVASPAGAKPAAPAPVGTAAFTRLFPTLPGYAPDSSALFELGAANTLDGSAPGRMFDVNAPENDNPDGDTSAFTYFGQFVDHDLTLDGAPLVDGPVDIATLRNGRTPALDLDSVYGGGPAGSPQLYDGTGRFLLSQNGRDHQRRPDGSAVLVEGRNDENLVIAQVHVAFERFHNAQVDAGLTFEQAKASTVRHYQWIVLRDFLPRVAGERTVLQALGRETANQGLFNWRAGATMPVEFSTAAYRFGHSMVRRAYTMGADGVRTQVFNPAFPAAQDLRGGRPIPANLIISWENFAAIPGVVAPIPPILNVPRRIDTLLSSGLFILPPGAPGLPSAGPAELAARNMIRGKSYGLPSGQAVARRLGLTPLTNAQLGLTDPRLTEAPLWFYLLAEAGLAGGTELGPVGGRIVAETIAGLVLADPNSILRRPWIPPASEGGAAYRLGDLLVTAGVAGPTVSGVPA